MQWSLTRRCVPIFIVFPGNLQANGIYLPVSTVDTWVNIRDNSVFCQGDFIGANAQYASFPFSTYIFQSDLKP